MAESSDEFVIRYVPDFSAVDAGFAERERRAQQPQTIGGNGNGAPGTPSINQQSTLPPAATVNRTTAGGNGALPPTWQAQVDAQMGGPASVADPAVARRVDRNWDAASFAQFKANERGQQQAAEQSATYADRQRQALYNTTERLRRQETREQTDERRAARVMDRIPEADRPFVERQAIGRMSQRGESPLEALQESARLYKQDSQEHRKFLSDRQRAQSDVVSGYRELARDTIRQLATTARRESNAFSADLSEMGPNRRLRAINNRLEGMDPLDPEFNNLRRQRANLRGPRGGTGLNTEVLPMGQYMNLMFGGWEAASAFNAAMTMNNPLLNRGSLQTMQTQQAAIQKMSSGILGSMAAGGLNVLDMYSIYRGDDVTNTSRGFGILGKRSPLAAQQAQADAMRGIEMAKGQLGAALEGRGVQSGLFADQGLISAMGAGDPFQRGRQGAANEWATKYRQLQDRQFELRQSLTLANTIGDTEASAKIAAQLNQFDKDAPKQYRSAGDVRDAAIAGIGRDEAAFRGNTRARGLALSGDSLGSATTAIQAKYLPLTNAEGQLSDTMMESFRTDMREAQINEERRQILRRGQVQEARLNLSRNPVMMQLATLRANRSAALEGVTDPGRIGEINELAQLGILDIAQRRADTRQDVGLNLMGRRSAITALEDRNPLGANVSQLVAQSQSEEVRLRRNGLDSEANQVRDITRRQVNLMERDYREGFQFQQLESKLLLPGLFNLRDNEDPQKVLGSFRDARSALSQPTEPVTGEQAVMELGQETVDALSRGIAKEMLTLLQR